VGYVQGAGARVGVEVGWEVLCREVSLACRVDRTMTVCVT
jgi:hypothetical protein